MVGFGTFRTRKQAERHQQSSTILIEFIRPVLIPRLRKIVIAEPPS